jgi:enoyl-CoA hydratase/carnithine racemase
MSSELEYERGDDGVATLLLNRPERRNAFTPTMLDQWYEALLDADASPEVRAVVVRGAGGAFCAGVDFDELERVGAEALAMKRFISERVQRIPRLISRMDKPVIACVNGPAVGAGMDMALMCDLRFAGSDARFCESYIKIGLVPGAGGCYYLTRIVGLPKALELFFGGQTIDAEEALRLGLVNQVYAPEEAVERTYEFARRLAAAPPLVVSAMKRTIYQSARSDLDTALDLVSGQIGVLRSSEDSQESFAALREKREPRYVGN